MKTLITSLWVLLFLMLAISCRNDDLGPIITFDTAIKGAYVRLIDETPRELDLAKPFTAQYAYTIEFVDFEQGALVDQYDIYARYEDNNPDNGDESSSSVLVISFNSSDFSVNENGYYGLSVVLTLEELSSTLGIEVEDIQPLDLFNIEGEIITEDGRTFMYSNSSAAINGSAFQGHFRFSLKATCPLPDDWFVGEYLLINDLVCGDWCYLIWDQPVSLSPSLVSSTQREFDVIFSAFPEPINIRITIEILCAYSMMVSKDIGVGCGNNIVILSDGPQPIDLNDPEAVIHISYVVDTGDCATGIYPHAIRLKPIV